MEQSQIRFFIYRVHDLARLVRRWQEKISEEEGLTMPQLRTIAQLCKHDGISQAELAGLIESDPMTMSGILERLEAKGMVRRGVHPTDSRVKTVQVTDEARTVLKTVRDKGMAYEPQVFKNISAEEIKTTFSVLERIDANLMEAYAHYEESRK